MNGLVGRIRWWLGLRGRQPRRTFIGEAAMSIATTQAMRDRAILARFRANRDVELSRKDIGTGQRDLPEVKAFVRDIESRALGERNLAIKPKRRKR